MKPGSLPRCLTGVLLLAALVLTATGCKKEKPTASVSGKVTYNGKPLTGGNVNFVSSSGSAAQSVLGANGEYSIEGPLDTGEFKVYVSPPIPGQAPPPGTKVSSTPFNVTPKFQSPESSGVKVTLNPGSNEIPIDLKD